MYKDQITAPKSTVEDKEKSEEFPITLTSPGKHIMAFKRMVRPVNSSGCHVNVWRPQ